MEVCYQQFGECMTVQHICWCWIYDASHWGMNVNWGVSVRPAGTVYEWMGEGEKPISGMCVNSFHHFDNCKDNPENLRHRLQFKHFRTWIQTIFVTWRLRVTGDSIHNSCDVYFILEMPSIFFGPILGILRGGLTIFQFFCKIGQSKISRKQNCLYKWSKMWWNTHTQYNTQHLINLWGYRSPPFPSPIFVHQKIDFLNKK